MANIAGIETGDLVIGENRKDPGRDPPMDPMTVESAVDGSEIRRSPVGVGSWSHFLQGFIHLSWFLFGDFWTINIH